MKIKPKDIRVNLPAVHLFDDEADIPALASAVNTIINGKVKMKYETLGTLGGQFVGLFYLQRNDEFQELHNQFRQLIEDEEIAGYGSPEPDDKIAAEPKVAHGLCEDCEELSMLHQKGELHCICGNEWRGHRCYEPKDDQDY
jgi:hypothetical protein